MTNLQSIAKVRYTHDAVIDQIIANPSIAQKDLAKMFGFQQSTMSIIVNSDAFKERLAERKAELTDPVIREALISQQEKLDAVAHRAMDKILERLDNPAGNIKNLELVAMAKLGVGDKNNRAPGPTQQNNLFVVHTPPAAKSAEEWLPTTSRNIRNLVQSVMAPPGGTEIIENTPGV